MINKSDDGVDLGRERAVGEVDGIFLFTMSQYFIPDHFQLCELRNLVPTSTAIADYANPEPFVANLAQWI